MSVETGSLGGTKAIGGTGGNQLGAGKIVAGDSGKVSTKEFDAKVGGAPDEAGKSSEASASVSGSGNAFSKAAEKIVPQAPDNSRDKEVPGTDKSPVQEKDNGFSR